MVSAHILLHILQFFVLMTFLLILKCFSVCLMIRTYFRQLMKFFFLLKYDLQKKSSFFIPYWLLVLHVHPSFCCRGLGSNKTIMSALSFVFRVRIIYFQTHIIVFFLCKTACILSKFLEYNANKIRPSVIIIIIVGTYCKYLHSYLSWELSFLFCVIIKDLSYKSTYIIYF